MKKYILLTILGFAIFSCKKTSKTEQLKNHDTDKHSIQQSVNWHGSYFGKLPCTSCEEIKMLITLNSDGTYIKEYEIVDSEEKTYSQNGTFKWLKNGYNIILDDKTEFKVGKETLSMISEKGKKIPEDLVENYILNKTEIKQCADNDNDENIHLKTYKDSNGITYKITYNTNTEKPTALITTNSFSKKLIQTTAWAKGAEYELDNYKLISKGDKAILFINNKKIALNLIQ